LTTECSSQVQSGFPKVLINKRDIETMTMLDMLKIIAAALIIQLIGAATLSHADAKAVDCLTDWAKAAPIVKSEGLTPATDLKMLAKTHVEGDLTDVSLCKGDTGYVYRLTFIQNDGNVVELEVDAKKPW
jgi:uncharacterized membrane protein YkoI